MMYDHVVRMTQRFIIDSVNNPLTSGCCRDYISIMDYKVSRPDARATDAQLSYLRRLLHEAFSLGISSCFDVYHLDRTRRGEASTEIDRLKKAIQNIRENR